jgi:hypothetical protein
MPHHLCDWRSHSGNQRTTLGTRSSPIATQVWSKPARQVNSQGIDTGLGYVVLLLYHISISPYLSCETCGAIWQPTYPVRTQDDALSPNITERSSRLSGRIQARNPENKQPLGNVRNWSGSSPMYVHPCSY